jgi:hypothetical protein
MGSNTEIQGEMRCFNQLGNGSESPRHRAQRLKVQLPDCMKTSTRYLSSNSKPVFNITIRRKYYIDV